MALHLPGPVQQLLAALGQLPGIGPRSAERIALHIVQGDPGSAQNLAHAITQARERIRNCTNCGALTEADPCSICSDSHRDASIICVVERPVDIFSIEKSGAFKGKFHVLGGKISPMNGVAPEDLRIAHLETRLTREPVKEIVLALPTDVEGDATSFYLAKHLVARDVKITRLAYGLPAGSGLEYADELTLSRALEGRREVTS